MSPVIDYEVESGRDFTPVEDGIYAARLTGSDLVMPKEQGKFPYYNLEFTAEPEANIGKRKFWMIASLSPGGFWKFKQTMLVLGANPSDVEPGSGVDTDEIVRDCLEATCRLTLKQVDYPKKDGSTGRKSEIQEVLASDLPF